MRMTKKQLARLAQVESRVEKAMQSHDGSAYGRALASEGFAGGYLQALRHVELFLRTGAEPSHSYWFTE